MGLVSSSAPSNLVDLLLDFERLEVVKFWLVRLEFGVKLVLAALFGLVPFEKDYATALVTCKRHASILSTTIRIWPRKGGLSHTGRKVVA
jgi:hypothetical protein